jgi:hypothetical protein
MTDCQTILKQTQNKILEKEKQKKEEKAKYLFDKNMEKKQMKKKLKKFKKLKLDKIIKQMYLTEFMNSNSIDVTKFNNHIDNNSNNINYFHDVCKFGELNTTDIEICDFIKTHFKNVYNDNDINDSINYYFKQDFNELDRCLCVVNKLNSMYKTLFFTCFSGKNCVLSVRKKQPYDNKSYYCWCF